MSNISVRVDINSSQHITNCLMRLKKVLFTMSFIKSSKKWKINASKILCCYRTQLRTQGGEKWRKDSLCNLHFKLSGFVPMNNLVEMCQTLDLYTNRHHIWCERRGHLTAVWVEQPNLLQIYSVVCLKSPQKDLHKIQMQQKSHLIQDMYIIIYIIQNSIFYLLNIIIDTAEITIFLLDKASILLVHHY